MRSTADGRLVPSSIEAGQERDSASDQWKRRTNSFLGMLPAGAPDYRLSFLTVVRMRALRFTGVSVWGSQRADMFAYNFGNEG
jgi:hypothetical protein